MFHWGPSSDGILGFPAANAGTAAGDFLQLLRDIEKYNRNHSSSLLKVPFTLLVHSIGSIVLEPILKSKMKSLGKLFETVVITSSASNGKDHAVWLEHINFSDNIYVMVNQDDPMLGLAELTLGRKLLGRGLVGFNGEKIVLADNAFYVDVTGTSLGHRYYLHKDLTNRKSFGVKVFFDRV